MYVIHSALSLLSHLCGELLGPCLPLPDVPRLFGYVLESSVSPRRHRRLTSLYSDGNHAYLRDLTTE
jgi:hypothetical protein